MSIMSYSLDKEHQWPCYGWSCRAIECCTPLAGQWPAYRSRLWGVGLLLLLLLLLAVSLAWPGLGLNVNITLFSRVTLISKVQSTSDLDCFHARYLLCSRVKSHDDPINGCQGDSAVPYCSISTLCSKKSDAKIQITITMAHLIRINYPLSSFNYLLFGTNVANFIKIRHIVSEQ